jgi:hypothetical protein
VWKRSGIEANPSPPEQIKSSKASQFTGLSEQFQFVGSGISKVDMSVMKKDVSKCSSALEKPLQCYVNSWYH